jgi:hypothetical protein
MIKMADRQIRWAEAHRTGGEAIITISEEKAVKEVQKSIPKSWTLSYDEALEFFMTCHTAWYVEDEELSEQS